MIKLFRLIFLSLLIFTPSKSAHFFLKSQFGLNPNVFDETKVTFKGDYLNIYKLALPLIESESNSNSKLDLEDSKKDLEFKVEAKVYENLDLPKNNQEESEDIGANSERKVNISIKKKNPFKSTMETSIKIRVNNEIVTTTDIEMEYNYLIALNNEIQSLDEATILKLSKDSIIREKIKKAEIIKYYDLNENSGVLDQVVKEFYTRLGLKDISEFESYLIEYNLKLEGVKDKIKIETMWNRLIGEKYSRQININEEELKKQVENNYAQGVIVEYELSEIIFQLGAEEELDKKVYTIQKSIDEQGFSNAANIFSVADTSKFGGNIGWVEERSLSTKINQIIKQLPVGGISGPIKTPNGFLILKIENKKDRVVEFDKNELLKQAIMFETNRQFNQFSIIYYNKINLNTVISEQ